MDFKLAAFADEASNLFEGQINALIENRLDYIEIRNIEGRNIAEFSVEEAAELRRRLEERGLAVWSVGSRLGKIGINDPFEPHMQELMHTLELARALGCDKIRMFSFYLPEGACPADYREEVISRLTAMAEAARGSGIKLCHENEKGIYGAKVAECLDIAKSVPELGCVFDPANFVQCGVDTEKAWEALSPYITYLHIKDALTDGRVVPAGMGAGKLSYLVKEYLGSGGRVMTLEPHLTLFDGLASLETRRITEDDLAFTYPSAEAAFAVAVNSLRDIIAKI